MRIIALALRSINEDIDIIGIVCLRCMVQAIVDGQGNVRRVPENLRMPESLLKARRRAAHTDGILVCSAEKDLSENRIVQ